MGAVKQQMLELEGMEGLAQEVAIAAGLGSRCHIHEDVFVSDGPDPDLLVSAYKLGNSRINKGQIVLPSSVNRQDFSALIKEVVEMGPESCPECDRTFGKDD
jgi:hypothetical protein